MMHPELVEACRTGNVAKVERLLINPDNEQQDGGSSVDPNSCDENGRHALIVAASHSCVDVMARLLNAGANPNLVETQRAYRYPSERYYPCSHYDSSNTSSNSHCCQTMTALYVAASSGSDDMCAPMIHLLLRYGANANWTDQLYGDTPLHVCRTVDGCKLLLEQGDGVDLNAQNASGMTPLHKTICLNRGKRMIRYLLDQGADPTIRDNQGRTALNWAAREGRTKLASVLLEHSNSNNKVVGYHRSSQQVVNSYDDAGYTPYYHASIQGNFELMQLLLDNGADKNNTQRNRILKDCQNGVEPAVSASIPSLVETVANGDDDYDEYWDTDSDVSCSSNNSSSYITTTRSNKNAKAPLPRNNKGRKRQSLVVKWAKWFRKKIFGGGMRARAGHRCSSGINNRE